MALDLVAGPAGAGKSQWVADRLRPGQVLIDFSALFLAVAPDAAGAERRDGDERLALVAYLRTVAAREANRRGLRGYVTTGSGRRDVIEHLREAAGGGRVFVVDPGEPVVRERLRRSQRGRDIACDRAVRRWYDNYEPADGDIAVTEPAGHG